jgi:hypothetical protein
MNLRLILNIKRVNVTPCWLKLTEYKTMLDRDFLIWIYERLEHVHGESPMNDYMRKLSAVIKATDKKQLSPNVVNSNGLQELVDGLDS